MCWKTFILIGSLVAAGCASGGGNASSSGEKARSTAREAAAATSQAAVPVTLVGKSGCGHCTFGVGQSCAAAVQTADGSLYILDGVDPEADLFKTRMDGKTLKVTGTVSEQEGLKHLALASYETL